MGDLNPPKVYPEFAGDPRYPYSRKYEIPAHEITFARPFAIGKFEVTKAQFALFVDATGFEPAAGCLGRLNGKEGFHDELNWRAPGFEQTDDDPVVCVNRYDAEKYMAWLSEKTGQTYRFPTEAEWEYVVRAGTRHQYPWGDEPGVGHANCKNCGSKWDDKRTSPAGSFAGNAWGVYDMAGNVWEPLLDCFIPGYEGAPADGSARETAGCERRGLRGGSWYDKVAASRSAMRGRGTPINRIGDLGFRVVREMD
jgi:formylglycine-generating enzyme required for sulfatase activity